MRVSEFSRDMGARPWLGVGRCTLLGLIGLAVLAAPVAAADPVDPMPPAELLRCSVVDGGVLLEWDPIAFFAPIHGYLITRDGDVIAKLPEGSTSYFDPDVPRGEHVYVLAAINWDGTVAALGKCAVTVEDFGLRCKVEEGFVHLEWGPILIDVLILEFQIFRNRELIATVPGNVLSYTDRVPDLGKYRYSVVAIVGPGASFIVGTCYVEIRCYNLAVEIKDLQVHMEWKALIPTPEDPPSVYPLFLVQRDGELVGTTEKTEYTDTVPGPGQYTYRILMDLGTGGVRPIQIAACEVFVPGEFLPPPRDLTCVVVVPPGPVPLPGDPTTGDKTNPEAVDTDGDGVVDAFLPIGTVILKWVNPIAYDDIIISRNGMVIATLPGDTESYFDQVHGGEDYFYEVVGVRAHRTSPPATCKVWVPPDWVPPPQDFVCYLIDTILNPDDPANPAKGGDEVEAPVDVVFLKWWNPIRYAALVILRDGTPLTELEGSAMMYRDVAPPQGHHIYGIYGVVEDGTQSETVECEIWVGPGPVPPVEDLRCYTPETSPDEVPSTVVLLQWKNAASYDMIVILRDGMLLVELPGALEEYQDIGVEPGIHIYEVIAIVGDQRSQPVLCEVFVVGPPDKNVLYFSSPSPLEDSDQPPSVGPFPGSRATCMAMNVDPLQGWSFGVASDPQFIVPEKFDIEGTATQALNNGAGPDFLHLAIVDDPSGIASSGVVMAVIVDTGTEEPFETLPPGESNALLNIQYAAGPLGVPGEIYPIRYSSHLGDPPVGVLFVVKGFELTPGTRPGWVSLGGTELIRGDADENGELQMADAIRTLAWLFLGGEKLWCMEAADANGTGEVNIADPIFTLQYLYGGGPQPPYPFPDCGWVPSQLGCERHMFCNPYPDTP